MQTLTIKRLLGGTAVVLSLVVPSCGMPEDWEPVRRKSLFLVETEQRDETLLKRGVQHPFEESRTPLTMSGPPVVFYAAALDPADQVDAHDLLVDGVDADRQGRCSTLEAALSHKPKHARELTYSVVIVPWGHHDRLVCGGKFVFDTPMRRYKAYLIDLGKNIVIARRSFLQECGSFPDIRHQFSDWMKECHVAVD